MSHIDPHATGGSHPTPNVGHEQDDVDIKALISFTVGMFVVIAVVSVLMWGLMKVFQNQAAKNDPPQSPLARPAVEMPASTVGDPVFGRGEGVQLLTSEPTVLRQVRESEAEALNTYGWVDEKTGVARIPISEAKKLLLERGLPARGEPADPTLGTLRGAYGESSSGRVITAKPLDAAANPEGTKQEAAPPAAHEKGHQ
jgi:hypothetical protein